MFGAEAKRRPDAADAIVVFSHLRWSFVFKRPQHLLSRLARHRPVMYVEEPRHGEGAAHLEFSNPCAGVEVVCPVTPIQDAPGFSDPQLAALRPLLVEAIAARGLRDYVAWFYTPMALPLLAGLAPARVVYDCMDELSVSRAAPRQLKRRESALMLRAGVVFTSGPSLYAAKCAEHPRVICLPNAVDAAHYAAPRAIADTKRMNEAEALQAGIAGPRLGYVGVIDERLDLKLVAHLADARPDWQIVMVGPVAKIDPGQLPRRANLHWLGPQDHAVLPQLVASWSVCLMPFALNEATRSTSPTKTLEYMAAGKPIVSTPIVDVVNAFAEVVEIAAEPEAFVAACARALAEGEVEAAQRRDAMVAIVASTSWDAAAARVLAELKEMDNARLLVRSALANIVAQSSAGALARGREKAASPRASVGQLH